MKFESVFAEVFSIPEDSVKDDLALQDIPTWDSMAHIILIMHIEEGWNIQLTSDEIADMKTVSDARRLILSHGGSI
jgi:acyl carrier protein